MKIQADINVTNLRKIAHMIIKRSFSDIAKMSDEELVVECAKRELCAASGIQVVKEKEGEQHEVFN